ncbi:MAG: F0F1 ATP synthase subunit delta, partial [Candidatus Limnocylindrales bacterium]
LAGTSWQALLSMARRTSSARRYAEAAFELAIREGDPEGWRRELEAAAERLAEPVLARVLGNRGLPLEGRLELLTAALGTGVRRPVLNLAALLLHRGRLELLPGVAQEFGRLDRARQGITPATATSAAPLEADEVAALTERLRELTGGSIELAQRVDPALLGGVVVQLGDRLIDGSVRGRLERLRHELASGVL